MWHAQKEGHAKKAKSNGKKLRRHSMEVHSALADEAEGGSIACTADMRHVTLMRSEHDMTSIRAYYVAV